MGTVENFRSPGHEEESDLIRTKLGGVDVVFILAGLGGGTGGGMAPSLLTGPGSGCPGLCFLSITL